MAKIGISIYVDEETNEVEVIQQRSSGDEKQAVLFQENEESLLDYNQAMELINSYGDYKKVVRMGKTEFVIVYDEHNEVSADLGSFVIGDCIIMKNSEDLEGIEKDELYIAILEFKNRVRSLRIGYLSTMGYELD